MKYKKIIVMLVFMIAFMAFDGLVFAQTITEGSESIEVDLYGDDISVAGKLKEINEDITIVVYRNSDNAKYYIDQGKTNENGEYSFQFGLPNGSYKAVVTCGSQKYTTSDIVINKKSGGGGGSSKKGPDVASLDNSLVFTDITGHWAEDNIKKIIASGSINGYPDGTFKPDNNITRAEFITVLVKAFNMKSTSEGKFEDARNHWAKDFINSALDNKIIQGYSDSLFGPNELITREQMAVMVVNALKLEVKEYEISFDDKDQISDWAIKYVATSVNEKLLVGYPDNTFRPKSSATRAEAVTVILNALNSISN
jgi:S-layer family protein